MQHFQSKIHIVHWLESNCPRPAIVRSLREGKTEFFGGFNPISPTTQPGWIIRVTSAYNRIWYVAVIAYRDHYGIRILRDVPWDKWVGTMFWDGDKFRSQLFSGDYPLQYLELRRMWNEYRYIYRNK